MTVIAGWHDNKQAWIGGDSGAFSEQGVVLTESKVWKTEDGYLLGAAGDFRIAEIAYESGIGDPHKLRDHIERWAKESMVGENDTDFLVISPSGVWVIGADFSVVRCKENYGAVGGGSVAALPAFFALNNISMTGKERVSTVLKASAYHTTSVRAPFKIISI